MSVKIAHTRRHHPKEPAAASQDGASRSPAEAGLERRCRELERTLSLTRAEFAQFAHAASHDLQAPLHKIVAFGELLQRRLTGLDETSLDYLARMRNAARHQSRLIDDLLKLVRVTTHGRPPEDVDGAAVAREAAADVEARRAPLDGRVQVRALPRLRGDPAQLRLLFDVLIDNAVKFRRPDEPLRVEVGGRELPDGTAEIVVKDAGIGFDERFLDRIFMPFQRLHAAHEYDGTGVGLAVADKIVARHGGTIAARSVPGHGAEFAVRFPPARATGS